MFDLFGRGWAASWDDAVVKLGIGQVVPAICDVEESVDDDWHHKAGKRLKRGSKFMANPSSIPKYAATLFIMNPYQHLMAWLFAESKVQSANIVEYTTRLNGLMNTVVDVFAISFSDGEELRFMRFFWPRVDVFTEEWRMYIRQEMLRALGVARN